MYVPRSRYRTVRVDPAGRLMCARSNRPESVGRHLSGHMGGDFADLVGGHVWPASAPQSVWLRMPSLDLPPTIWSPLVCSDYEHGVVVAYSSAVVGTNAAKAVFEP